VSYPFDPAFRAELAARCEAFPRLAHEGDALKPAAVAIALTEADDGSGETAFLLTRRAARMRAHAGQWALPGGRCDPGETPAQAALRELEEELGIRLPAQHILGLLDDYPTRSGYAVTPVVAWLPEACEITPNPHEVASVHHIHAPTAALVYQLRELTLGRITRVAELEQPVFAWR
jgi:mutator protein MutT